MSNKILVTGGAGYIGSHVVRLLTDAGQSVVVLDNLSTGFSDAVLGAELVVGDTGDRDMVSACSRSTVSIPSCILPRTPSCPNPSRTRSSTMATTPAARATCWNAARAAGVKHFIFSSTAAVYGIPDEPECTRRQPVVADQSLRHIEADE